VSLSKLKENLDNNFKLDETLLSTQQTPMPAKHRKSGKTKNKRAINIQYNKEQSPKAEKKKYKN